ncbi:phage tail spike protein [Clostridium akagii]|uniref:phage tail spike protein n=1 Tax=Clostridium akagii TaxID=91623 RepID=UPI000479BB84|nr:phage tail spike protein [Clostridium akagii]
MIILYDKNKTSNFDRNDLVLQNVTKCEVTWEKNGQFQIDLIYAITPGDTIWESIVKGAIIKCPVAHQQDQLFRLNTPTKKMDENSQYMYIEVTGYHITYDLNYNFLEDVKIANMSGIDAGNYILANTQYLHPFSWVGDIASVNTAEYVRRNVVDALVGSNDQEYINLWGGELVRDNFNIGMYKQAGQNNGVVIKYSKNLTGFEQSADDSNLITRAMPTLGSTSTTTDSTDTSTDTVLPEKYVDSPLINNYANIYVKEVQVTLTDAQKLLPNDQIYQLMRDYVNAQYANHIDIPIYSYVVNFIELSKTEEYKKFAILEEVKPYDFITIKALDIDVIAELVGYTYDSLVKRYEEVTLGNVQNDIIRSNQKSLFQLSQQNQQSIKILQAQMGYVPNSMLSIANSATSGGNNLFDHALVLSNTVQEWVTSGASVVTDPTLHDTDSVWKLTPNGYVNKNDVIINPNNYIGKQMVFSLQAKYSDITLTDSGEYGVFQSNVLLGALDAVIKRCLVGVLGTTWNFNSAGTGLISEMVTVTPGTSITISNQKNYSYILHGYDNNQNFVVDFTVGSIPAGVSYMVAEILVSLSPQNIVGFNVAETNPYTSPNICRIYANQANSDWTVQEQDFNLATEHPSDIIQSINFRSLNGDSNATIYIAAFMINTGTVRSDFSQSSNDTVETLVAHQIVADYITAKSADIDNLHVTNETVDNISIGIANVIDLTTGTLKAGSVTADSIKAGTITVGSAIIANGAITNALIANAAVQTEQIADGSVTDLKVVDLSANSITAGTLSVDRLVIRGTNSSIVYALNNITGALQSQNVDTLNGETLTPRTLTADKLVADSITANEIASKTITANEILTNTITANEIKANTITSNEIKANTITVNELSNTVGSNLDISSNTNLTLAIKNVQVGGVNFLTKNSMQNIQQIGGNSVATYNGGIAMDGTQTAISIASGTNPQRMRFNYVLPSINGNYNISFWAKTTGSVNINGAVAFTDLNTQSIVITPNWTKISVAINVTNLPYSTNFFEITVTTPSVTALFDKIMIESGNKASDWVPAIVDSNAQIFNISFNNLVNCAVNYNVMTKLNNTTGWDAGGGSPETISNGLYVEETVTATTGIHMTGLSYTNPDASYEHIQYAFYVAGNSLLHVYENNVDKGGIGTWAVGDVLRLSRENGNILYYKNGVLLYTSTTPTTQYPLYLDTSIYAYNSTITVKSGSTLSGVTFNSSILSSINLSPEAVTINANKINLNGYATFSSLSTPGTTTINGSNITTGTINANLVTVTNLNASNITTGNLTADRISGGTLILGGATNGVAIVKNAGNHEVVRLDTDGLTITLQNTSTGLFGNAFRIQAYTGTTLLNIDGGGQLIYAGVFSVGTPGNVQGETIINDGLITVCNSAGTPKLSMQNVYPQVVGDGSILQLSFRNSTADGNGVVLEGGGFRSAGNATMNLGNAGYRWATLYAASGTINTSDRNEKNTIESLDSSKATEFIMAINPVSYKLNCGESNRTHYGMIAQDVEDTMVDLGMTSLDFAGFIKSPKTKPVLGINEAGHEQYIDVVIPNEYTYGLRYEEFISPLIKCVQQLNDKITSLENEMSELKNGASTD